MMQGLMEFNGHTVVQPLGKLSKPLEDYFTDPQLWGTPLERAKATPEHWFSLSEQSRKECIRRRDGERCFITGEPSRTIHEFATRGANASAALVPWNMAVVSATIHDYLHRVVMKVLEFDPLEETAVIYGVDGHLMSPDDIWFCQRERVVRLQKVEARIQGLAMIEGDIAKDLYELSKGFKLLEPDAVSFAQYIAGRNVSATKATQAARAYGWMEKWGLFWPTGLTSEKADIVRKATRSRIPKNSEAGLAIIEVQAWLDGAVDQSVSDLKSNLADAKLISEPVRWYVYIGHTMGLVRARNVMKVLESYETNRRDMVLRVDKFAAGLNWDRKTGILSDRDGVEIPYRDLT